MNAIQTTFHSITFKVLGIGFLTLLMLIPLAQVQGLIGERNGLRENAVSQIASSWGVRSVLGILPGRVTFVFDKQGVVRHRFESNVRFGKHVDEALQIVKTLG